MHARPRLCLTIAAFCTLVSLTGCGRYEGPAMQSDESGLRVNTAACAIPPLPRGEEVHLTRGSDGALELSWNDFSAWPPKDFRYRLVAEDDACMQRSDIVQLIVATRAEDLGSRNPEFDSWVMSPDTFGPITTEMTKDEIVATGAFQVAPNACATGRLDWYSQRYERLGQDSDRDGEPDRTRIGPGLPGIELGVDGKPEFISPGSGARTEAGIRNGDSLKKLRAAYPGRLVRDEDMEQGELGAVEDHYAVSGKRSHLVFYVYKDKVGGFYLERGAVREGQFHAAVRGIGC